MHSKAIQRQQPLSRKTIIQYIHQWLPTHNHPGTKKDITTKCPCCHIAEETNDHFLLCDNSQIETEWNHQLENFYNEMKSKQMDPILLYFMILALSDWKTIKAPEPPAFCHCKYKQLFREQLSIEWNQVIRSRLSKTWVDIQNNYDNHQTLNGLSIITTATTQILTMIHTMWKLRCDIKYRGIDQNVYRNNILIPKIHDIYNRSQDINIIDKSYFEVPIATIIEYRTPKLQHWIRKTELFLKQSIYRTTQQLQQIPKITTFFAPRPKKTDSTLHAPIRVFLSIQIFQIQ